MASYRPSSGNSSFNKSNKKCAGNRSESLHSYQRNVNWRVSLNPRSSLHPHAHPHAHHHPRPRHPTYGASASSIRVHFRPSNASMARHPTFGASRTSLSKRFFKEVYTVGSRGARVPHGPIAKTEGKKTHSPLPKKKQELLPPKIPKKPTDKKGTPTSKGTRKKRKKGSKPHMIPIHQLGIFGRPQKSLHGMHSAGHLLPQSQSEPKSPVIGTPVNRNSDEPTYMNILQDTRKHHPREKRRTLLGYDSVSIYSGDNVSVYSIDDHATRLSKLKRFLDRNSIEDWNYDDCSINIEGIANNDLLYYPYRDIVPKVEPLQNVKWLNENPIEKPKANKKPAKRRKVPIPRKPVLASEERSMCSLCKLGHKPLLPEEAPYMKEMRKDRKRQELMTYRTKMGMGAASTTVPYKNKRNDALHIYNFGNCAQYT